MWGERQCVDRDIGGYSPSLLLTVAAVDAGLPRRAAVIAVTTALAREGIWGDGGGGLPAAVAPSGRLR